MNLLPAAVAQRSSTDPGIFAGGTADSYRHRQHNCVGLALAAPVLPPLFLCLIRERLPSHPS
jgi:hypothetical protein